MKKILFFITIFISAFLLQGCSSNDLIIGVGDICKVDMGEIVDLQVENKTGETLEYIFSNDNVVEINGDVIKAIAPGSVAVKITAGENSRVCTIEVASDFVISSMEKNVYIKYNSLTGKYYESIETLTAETVHGMVTWSSDNKSVIDISSTIGNTVVLAVYKPGTAVISANFEGRVISCVIICTEKN